MEAPDTSPLRFNGAIVVDDVQRKLDEARKRFRKAHSRGYLLSEQDRYDDKARRTYERAKAAFLKAEAEYAAARQQ